MKSLSPRQYAQLAFIGVMVVFGVFRIATGHPIAGGLVLLAIAIAAASLIRFYALGGQPLDRGGQPFWKRPKREWLSSSPPKDRQ